VQQRTFAVDGNLEESAFVVTGARDLALAPSFGPGENASRKVIVQHFAKAFLDRKRPV
jgi:hypothetical protein